MVQVNAVMVTKSPAKQLITDMLFIVKQQQFKGVGILSDMVTRLQLDDLFLDKKFKSYLLLYNYKYDEVDVENFVHLDIISNNDIIAYIASYTTM